MSGIVTVSDERAVYRVLQRPRNIVVPAEANALDGFVSDTSSAYRNRSIVRERLHCATRTPSTLEMGNSFTGSHFLGVAMQDASEGDEPFELWMGNRKLAEACADTNDNRVHLFVIKEPLHLKGGESIRLVTGANERPYRIESIALLKRRPKACPRSVMRPLKLPKPKRRPGLRARRIALTIQVRQGAQAKRFPLTTGIPLPVGHLYDARRVELLDSSRRPIPVQVRANGQWPDGSVRWLLVDFQHDLTSNDRNVTLRYGRDVSRLARGKPLAIDAKGGVQIDTGAAKLLVPRNGFVLPGRVQLEDGSTVVEAVPKGGIRLKTADGKVYTSRGKVDWIEVVEAGPLRAVVKVECRHLDSRGRSMFRSTAYIHAYAGKAWFRVSYTFTNDNTTAEFTNVRELTLSTRLVPRPGMATSVFQDFDNHFTLSTDGRRRQEGRRHSGLLMSKTKAGACAVAVQNFWQNYPKGLTLGRKSIGVGICPDVSDVDYRVGGVEEDRLFYHLSEGAHKFKCGMSRTHELFYGFAPRGSGRDLQRQARAFLQTPVVRAEPEVYVRSGAVGQMAYRSSVTGFYEHWSEGARAQFLADRKRRRAYGMMNFGDWFGERRYNWGNLEYDTPWVFLNEFIRGGGPEWFELGAQAARHLVDVDTCHASSEFDAVGSQYAHCMGHVGGYYPQGYREMAKTEGTTTVAHTWVEGLFLYHGLTGDTRALDAARAACDNMAGTVDGKTFDFTNCRNPGWLLIHMCAGYRATLEKRYLNAAHIVVERVLERQRESGGWERMLRPGHCYCDPPRHTGNAAFMVSLLMAGLKRYHQITRDPRVRRCIIRAAHYVIDSYWVEETRTFRYTNCPHIWVHVSMNPQMLEGLGYAWQLSKSRVIGEVLVGAVERCFAATDSESRADRTLSVEVPGYPRREFNEEADQGFGKMISLRMRQAPFALFDYEKAKAARGADCS